MPVGNIFNVPNIEDPESFNVWAFAHMDHHRSINRAIYSSLLVALPEFSLDPIPLGDDSGAWMYQHQTMHNNQNAILGISGFDISEVKWRDKSLLEGWVWLHAQEHYQASQILGV